MTDVTRRVNPARHAHDVTIVYTLLRAVKLRIVNFRRSANRVLGPLLSLINATLYTVHYEPASKLPGRLLD